MTSDEWQVLIRMLRNLGLTVVSLDHQSGLITVKIPEARRD